MQTYQNQFHGGNSRMNGCGCRCSSSSENRPRSAGPKPYTDTCSCQDPLRSLPIAMAYVPWQTWRQIYEAETGLSKGTVFEELDKPFYGKGGRRR